MMISTDPPTAPHSIDQAILEWIQELSPHGVLITDEQLRIQRWNVWLESHSGLKRAHVVGRSVLDVFPELSNRRMDRYFRAALDGQVSLLSAALHGFLLAFPSPIREAGFLNMLQTARVAPLVEGGEVVGTITTIEDVTQREYQNSRVLYQHQRQELFSWALAQLIESPDPETMVKKILPRISAHVFVDTYFHYLVDSDGANLYLHSSAGVPQDVQQRIARITIGDALCGKEVGQGEPLVLSCVHRSNDAAACFAKELGLRSYVCNPLMVGDKFIGTLAFASRTRERFTDDEVEFTRIVSQYIAITIDRARNEAALRNAQRELSRHAGLLENKVQERTRKLQETIAELESFSYSLAHDVRAPLRHIRSFSDVLLEDHGHELSGTARNYVDSITRAIKRLDALTQDILEYSKVSSKPVQLIPVDVELLVHDIVAHSVALNHPNLVVIQSPLQRVMGERSLLHQCLVNLLENGLKFVRPNVAPRLVVRTEDVPAISPAVDGDPENPPVSIPASPIRWTRIWIEDNGIGISSEYHGKIFGIFERLSLQHEGTGIGLAIVLKAVQRMGGRLGVDSEPGKGSKFWIELPAAD